MDGDPNLWNRISFTLRPTDINGTQQMCRLLKCRMKSVKEMDFDFFFAFERKRFSTWHRHNDVKIFTFSMRLSPQYNQTKRIDRALIENQFTTSESRKFAKKPNGNSWKQIFNDNTTDYDEENILQILLSPRSFTRIRCANDNHWYIT